MTKISERIPTKVSDLDNDLPSPDWQESDQSSPAYIENRTHWKESGEPVYLIEPQTIDWRSGGTPISVGPAYQIPNAGDTVFFSGDECTATTFGETIQVHNMNKDIYLIFYPDYSVKFAAGSTGTYNVSAQLISETYHKLDNKYLNLDTELDSTSDNPVANKAVSAVLQGKVSDVQVNGTSVVNNGVAEIPYADTSNAGVVKIDATNGVGVESQHKLYINYASSDLIKSGIGNYRPITPPRQHESVFYGLAKAAGDTTQTLSSNAVGVYTEEAKFAIQKMISPIQTFKPMEFIARYSPGEALSKVTIDTDMNGEPFKLAAAQIILKVGTPTTNTRDYIRCNAIDNTGAKRGFPTLSLISAGGTSCWMIQVFVSFGGLGLCFGKSTATGNTQYAQLATFQGAVNDETVVIPVNYITNVSFEQYNENSTLIPADSEVIIYGCRVIE